MFFASSNPDGSRPSPEQLRAAQSRHSPPDNEVPGVISFAAVLGRSADVAVAVTGAFAYSTGISLQLAIRLRRPDPDDSRALHEQVSGHAFNRRSAEGALLLGLAYPDGRTASNVGPRSAPFDLAPEQPTLAPGGGGGGPTSHNVSYWLNPLPGPGDLTLVCAWPVRGLAETQTVIAADVIAAGVAGIVELWPWESAPSPTGGAPTRRTDLPPGGWFAEHDLG